MNKPSNPADLIANNRAWAQDIQARDPSFFPDLAAGQKPDYLWIGCADSRVPPNTITGVAPGEIFVHRNIANVVVHTDLNSLSVLQYAVDALEVKHVIVCGHYRCGGVISSTETKKHGLVDHWLRHIQDVARLHYEQLEPLPKDKYLDRLCELNVIEQVVNVCRTTTVREAWERGQSLTVHGWIYQLTDGRLQDLQITVAGPGDLAARYAAAVGSPLPPAI